MFRNTLYALIGSFLLLAGCSTQNVSVITGSNYDKSKDRTDYFVLPYGSLYLPGKWDKAHYNSVSGQQFFKNADSVTVAIAFTRIDQYEFNADGTKKGNEFVKAYYVWESEYFVDNFEFLRKIIEINEINNYMIFRMYRSGDDGNFDTYYLFGERNGNVSNFSVMITDKWTEDKKIEFLKELYLQNK